MGLASLLLLVFAQYVLSEQLKAVLFNCSQTKFIPFILVLSSFYATFCLADFSCDPSPEVFVKGDKQVTFEGH